MFPKKRGKTVFLALIAEVNKVDHAEYVSMKLNIHISCEYMFKTLSKPVIHALCATYVYIPIKHALQDAPI